MLAASWSWGAQRRAPKDAGLLLFLDAKWGCQRQDQRQVGRAQGRRCVSQECMPPTAAASRPPGDAPHIEASAYRRGNVHSRSQPGWHLSKQLYPHLPPHRPSQVYLTFKPSSWRYLTQWKDTTVGIFFVAVFMESPLCLKHGSLYKTLVCIFTFYYGGNVSLVIA